VLLLGDLLPFAAAIFTVNRPAAETLKGMEEWKDRSDAEVAQAPPVLEAIRSAVQRVNRQLAHFEQIRKYRVLPREFSIEEGELTATMKLRRARAIENLKPQIEEIYATMPHAPGVEAQA
jgi:long-chain acyl-CoA synthetase